MIFLNNYIVYFLKITIALLFILQSFTYET